MPLARVAIWPAKLRSFLYVYAQPPSKKVSMLQPSDWLGRIACQAVFCGASRP